MKQGGMVKNPFQTEFFERFSALSPPNGNFPDGLARKLKAQSWKRFVLTLRDSASKPKAC
jgi:hypothetical protein